MSIFDDPTFRRLYAAQVISLIATGLLTVALGLLAYDLSPDAPARVLGTALAIKMIAYVGMAPVMRAALDRLPRRWVLVGSDLVRLSMVAVLPFVSQTWQIYVLVFALQTASATFTPTFTATIPQILRSADDYTRAVSASRIAYDLEALASPLLAAALLTVIPYSGLFLLTSVGFAVSALLVVGARLPHRVAGVDTSSSFLVRSTQGFRIMLAHKVFRVLLAFNLSAAAATALVLVGSVFYIRTAFGLDATMLAVALGAFGAGSLTGAVGFPRAARLTSPKHIAATGAALCLLTLAAVTVALIVAPTPGALLGCWAVLGLGTSLVNTSAGRIIRDHTDATTIDDVVTAQFSASHAAYLLCYPLTGLLAMVEALWLAPAALGGLAILGGIVAWTQWRRGEHRTDDTVWLHTTARAASEPAAHALR